MTRLLRGLADRLNPNRDPSPSPSLPAAAPAVPGPPSTSAPPGPSHAATPTPPSADGSHGSVAPHATTPSPAPAAPGTNSSSDSSHLAPPAGPEGTPKPKTRTSSSGSGRSRRSTSPDNRKDNPIATLVGHVGDHLSRTFGSGGSGNSSSGEGGQASGRRRLHRSRPSTAPAGPISGEGESKNSHSRSSSRPRSSSGADGPGDPSVPALSSQPGHSGATPESDAAATTHSAQTRLSAWPEEDERGKQAAAIPLGQQPQQQQQQQATTAVTTSAPTQVTAAAPVPDAAKTADGTLSQAPTPADQPAQPPDAANSNDAVATFRSGSLKEYDLFTLGPYEWLSDNVLAFWFELIEAQIQDQGTGSASASLWPPSVVELMSALPEDMPPDQARGLFPPLKSVVLLPVNDGYSSESAQAPEAEGGSHWSLIVVTGADKGRKAKARHYDSMVPTNRESAQRVWERWCACFCPDLRTAGLEEADELEPQENESDCGLYVLALAGLLLLDRSPHPVAAKMAVRKVRAHEVERYRTSITDWLAKWRQHSTEQQAEWKMWEDVVRHVGPMPLLPI